jgi:tRNA (mo5U34)-methyltransferase
MSYAIEQLEREVTRYRWYHTLDLGHGVVTKGMFDHRRVINRCLLPNDLSGFRCLDVGTMDGFWAFEMERRGAAEVVASDVHDVEDLDWPPRWRHRITPTLDATKAARFALAHAALDSRVKRIERSVYELASDLGKFDLVFCGDLLLHLKDPITALQRMRSVCAGSTIVFNPVKRFRLMPRRPIAEFDGIDEFQWWLLSEASLKRMMLATGFDQVEVGRRFALPPSAGGSWKGVRAVLRGYIP